MSCGTEPVGTAGADSNDGPAPEVSVEVEVVSSETTPEAVLDVVEPVAEAGLGVPQPGTVCAQASSMPATDASPTEPPDQPARDGFAAVGAALGVSVGPMALIGQAAAGTGDGNWYVGVIAGLFGALTGGLSLPVLLRPSATGVTPEAATSRALTPAFGAVFLFTVGLLAGAVAAFPMGAVVASVSGLVAGPVAVFAWRLSGGRVAVAAATSLAVGTLVSLGISP